MQKPRGLRVNKSGHYWEPNKSQRALGFRSRTLSKDFTIACREADDFNAEVERYRLAVDRGQFRHPVGTLGHLMGLYRAHEDFTESAPSTQASYRKNMKQLERDLGDASLQAITHPVVQAYKRSMRDKSHMGNANLSMLRLLYSFAIREGYFLAGNPAKAFRRLKTKPRQVVWSDRDERAFLETCPPEMRLPYLLAIYTAQRQGDLLALPWSAWRDGSIKIRQSKTRASLLIPAFERLAVALEAEPRRSTLILTDRRGLPWKADWFRHSFARAMEAAGLEGLQFRDLRRTAIVRLAEAGAEIPEITAISGHKLEYCQAILETYLPRTRKLAARAVERMR